MKTRKFLATAALGLAMVVQALAADYKVNSSESTVKWNGKKVTGEHYGPVDLKNGKLQVESNQLKSGTIVIDMTTIKCDDIASEGTNQRLVKHLKSDDFFSVDKHPESTLKVKEVKRKSGSTYTLTGDLTIKGITHPVTFDSDIDVNKTKLTSKGVIEVDRTLYDIKFRSGRFFPDLGDNLIYDTFTLDFNIVAYASEDTVMKTE